jgi:DNA-binding FrmR family transcriptional regulator
MSTLSGSERQLIHRISGIEGHVRSLKRLISEDRECLEILMQIAAIRSAIERLSHVIFEEFVEATLENVRSDEERSHAIADIRAAMETLM